MYPGSRVCQCGCPVCVCVFDCGLRMSVCRKQYVGQRPSAPDWSYGRAKFLHAWSMALNKENEREGEGKELVWKGGWEEVERKDENERKDETRCIYDESGLASHRPHYVPEWQNRGRKRLMRICSHNMQLLFCCTWLASQTLKLVNEAGTGTVQKRGKSKIRSYAQKR